MSTCVFNMLGFPGSSLVKNLPAMWETWVRTLGWEDPLEKEKATHVSILAWRIPRTVSSMWLQRVGHDRVTYTLSRIAKTSPVSYEYF